MSREIKFETLATYGKSIVVYLHGKYPEYISPTKIAAKVGGETKSGLIRHSSWASPKLKALVRLGFVERNDKGHYRYIRGGRISQ